MSLSQMFIFLAQSSDTNADEIFTRILIAFCSIGIIWLASMGALIYRGMENRRRKAEGIEPLPPLWTWTYQLVMRVVNPSAVPESAKRRPAARKEDTQPIIPPAWDADMPAPDLDMLMGEFGAPQFDDFGTAEPAVDEDDDLSLDFDTIPESTSAIPADLPRQAHDLPAVDVDDEFALDVEDESVILDDESDPEAEPDSALDTDPDRESDPESELEAELDTEDESEAEPEEPVMSVPEPSVSRVSSASPGADAPSEAVELLRVWRDITDGSLIIEIKGRRFTSLADLRDADLERRLINVVKELVALVKSGGSAARQTQSQPQASQPRPSAQPAPSAPSAPSRPAAKPAPAASPTPDVKPARKLTTDEMPSMAPGDMFRQMGQIALGRKQEEPEDEPMPEPLSIPEQIDALLQVRLKTMPEYRGRGIEVQPSLGGLVIIKVDGKFYEGVGEVEDDDVRALLQDVVREWENSQ